ncbi:hypothetical protein RRG08_010591 [Elysia crispata]|uniref:TMEM205-like domain-containing protein n=1 Tax=Elysia crispata TaxID=231223 RepID=A0AAE1DRL5_9GAST|nr:hypothetical protein RRG08_010591 [Elysia crispata]
MIKKRTHALAGVNLGVERKVSPREGDSVCVPLSTKLLMYVEILEASPNEVTINSRRSALRGEKKMCPQSARQEHQTQNQCGCNDMLPKSMEKLTATRETSDGRPPWRRDGKQAMAGCVSLIARKLDALRMEHFQFCAVAVVTCFVSMQLFPLLTRSSHQSADDTYVPGVANGMLHLGSFGANFGAQMWVTFVAGLTMFYSLPRHMFGKVQSRLFPMFYLWSLVFSAVTLSTFLERHPYDSWDSSLCVRAIILIVCFLTAAVNSLVVSPAIVSAMLQTFKKEVEAGVGDVVGHTDVIELKKDPEYCASYRKFRRFHGLSAMLVVTSLVCNIVYLYHLTSLCNVAL